MNRLPPKVVNKKTESYDIYIGRGSIWGNPYKLTNERNRGTVIAAYENYILKRPDLLAKIPSLAGKRLGCVCKPKACHGDVLVKIFLRLMRRCK
jgi:hypothetical protein